MACVARGETGAGGAFWMGVEASRDSGSVASASNVGGCWYPAPWRYEASGIKEAILLAAENPLPDLAGFHLWYEHVSVGTVFAGEMRANAEVQAKELMVRHAKFSQSAGKDPLG